MKKLYVVLAVCLLWACQVTTAGAEGFALTEWSSRGLSLAGGMVGRADDPSAIAYNAAGITQLPGTHVMGGFAAIAPMGTIDLDLAATRPRPPSPISGLPRTPTSPIS